MAIIGSIGAAYTGGLNTTRVTPTPGAGETPSGKPHSDSRGLGIDTQLSDEEKVEVRNLKQRDAEVRRHEQAHVAAGGQYVQGGPQYEFTRGPDGRQYATGGEVSIDTSPGRTPEETIQKARVVRRAALAPAEPSPQDRRVAAQASQLEAKARQEIQQQRAEEDQGERGGEAGEVAPFQRQVSQFVQNATGQKPTLLDALA